MTPNQKPLTKREAGFAHASKVVKLGWRDNTNPSEIIMDFEAGADWQASLPSNDKQGWIDVNENETELVKYLHESIKESEAVYGPIKRVSKYGGSIFAIYEGGKCYRLNWQSYNQDIITLD